MRAHVLLQALVKAAEDPRCDVEQGYPRKIDETGEMALDIGVEQIVEFRGEFDASRPSAWINVSEYAEDDTSAYY